MRDALFILMVVVAATFGCASTTHGGNTPPEERDASVVVDAVETDSAWLDASDAQTAVDVIPQDVTADTGPAPDQMVIAGALQIAPDAHPVSTILVANTGLWHTMAQFRASATREDGVINRLTVLVRGDSANYDAIAVSVDGVVRGSAIPPSGVNQSREIELSPPIMVRRDSSVRLQLWARLGPVVPPSSVASRVGVALSGAEVGLGLNLEGRPVMGNPFIVRRTELSVAVLPATMELMRSGRQTLMSYRIGADETAPAGLKKIGHTIRVNRVPGSRMSVGSLRLQLNGSDLASTDYRILRLVGGGDLTNARLSPTEETVQVAIVFNAEETISGAGAEYALTAAIENAEPGDSINTSFIANSATSTTGTLTTDNFVSPLAGGTVGPFILPPYNGMGPMEEIFRVREDSFIWSDRSDEPHSRTSEDWIGDRFLNDLTVVRVISRSL